MNFKRRQRILFFQKFSGFFPSTLSFISFIDHILIDGHFLVIDKRLKLFVNKTNEISRMLPGYIDEFNHFSLITHFFQEFYIEYQYYYFFDCLSLIQRSTIIQTNLTKNTNNKFNHQTLQDFPTPELNYNWLMQSKPTAGPSAPQTTERVELTEEQKRKQEEFALKIKQHDQIKMLLRKLGIVKNGVLAERQRKKKLLEQMEKATKKIYKYDEENSRKEKKYQELTAQIKKLKDDLIEERNRKQELQAKILAKEEQLKSKNPEEQKQGGNLGLFGFRGLFSKS